MPLILPKPYAIALDVVAWAVVHVVVGYVLHRVPVERFARDNALTRGRRFERHGEFYQRWLRVKRWKAWLPEAGGFFRGGFDKKRLPAALEDGLARYVMETRRAELVHWLTAAVAPLFFLWNVPRAGVWMVAYGVAANVPCIVALRYNRLRLDRIIGARANRPRRTGTSGT